MSHRDITRHIVPRRLPAHQITNERAYSWWLKALIWIKAGNM